MLTFQKVMNLFQGYLEEDSCIEVIETKWGFVRLFFEEPYYESFDAALCRTPKELLQELWDSLIAGREQELEWTKKYERIEREIKKTGNG